MPHLVIVVPHPLLVVHLLVLVASLVTLVRADLAVIVHVHLGPLDPRHGDRRRLHGHPLAVVVPRPVHRDAVVIPPVRALAEEDRLVVVPRPPARRARPRRAQEPCRPHPPSSEPEPSPCTPDNDHREQNRMKCTHGAGHSALPVPRRPLQQFPTLGYARSRDRRAPSPHRAQAPTPREVSPLAMAAVSRRRGRHIRPRDRRRHHGSRRDRRRRRDSRRGRLPPPW